MNLGQREYKYEMQKNVAIKNSKILIVDDLLENIDILKCILAGEGYVISFATDGEEALNIALIVQPDLILMDILMPKLDGITACKKLKENADTAHIPVILISAKHEITDVVKGLKQGAVDYISKPIQCEEVKARVATHLKNAKLATELTLAKLEAECILSSIRDAIISVNDAGKIIYFNTVARLLFGINNENIDHIFEPASIRLICKGKELCLSEMIEDTLESRKILEIRQETELINFYKQSYIIKGLIVPLYNNAIKKMGIVITIQNITEQVELEKAIMRNEKVTSLSVLASGFAHEMNNPLAAIIHGIANVHRRIDPELSLNQKIAKDHDINLYNMYMYLKKREILEILDGITKVSKRASLVVRNIMRLDLGQNVLPEKNNINNLISNCLEQIKIAQKDIIDINKINFDLNFTHDLPTILCITHDIKFVITSLIKNSIEALAEKNQKDPMINIESNEMGTNVLIIIYDNGPKISNEVVSRMFDPFYTTNLTRTGLGLFMSYFMVSNRHYGNIQYIYDNNLKKNEFIVSLPINFKLRQHI